MIEIQAIVLYKLASARTRIQQTKSTFISVNFSLP